MIKFKRTSRWSAAAVAAAALGLSGTARASSHREAPAISNDPAADNTDLWSWMSTDNSTLYVVASYNPLEEPSGGPNFHKFSDDVLYEIHVTDPGVPNGQDGGATYDLNDAVTYQFRFTTTPAPYVDPADLDAGPPSTPDHVGGGKEFFSQISLQSQTYTVTKIDHTGQATVVASGLSVMPEDIGPRTQATGFALGLLSSGTYDEAYRQTFVGAGANSEKIFAGPTDDGFYVDLGGIFDLANLRGPVTIPNPDGGAGTPNSGPVAQDGVAGFNVHTIALAIPTSVIFGANGTPHVGTAGDDSTVGVWASASRKKVRILRNDGTISWYGPWTQVSRIGLPLINEAVIGIQDKDKYNRTQPGTDVANFAGYFLNPVIVRDADAVHIYQALGAEADVPVLETGRVDILQAINLAPTHNIAIAAGVTGDVLRVDTAIQSSFPNGRSLPMVTGSNQEGADVTDVLLTLLLSENLIPVSDNVDHNDVNYPGVFPYLALPHEGYSGGHGKPASP